MSNYCKDNISLLEALNMKLPHRVRVWEVPGLHISYGELPDHATSIKTSVVWQRTGPGEVRVEWSLPSKSNVYRFVGEEFRVLSVEELQYKFPRLFTLTGKLSASYPFD